MLSPHCNIFGLGNEEDYVVTQYFTSGSLEIKTQVKNHYEHPM